MRGTLLNLVEGIRKNIILSYSVELIGRLNKSITPSPIEYKGIKSYFNKEQSIISKNMIENQKESLKYIVYLIICIFITCIYYL